MVTNLLRSKPVRMLLVMAVVSGSILLGRRIVVTALSESLATYVERTPALSIAGRLEAADMSVSYAPIDPMTHLRRGGQYLAAATEEGNEEWAAISLEEVSRAARMSPEDYRIWMAMGRVEDRLGKTDEARRCFERALTLAPNYFDPNWAMGNHLLRAGDRDGAFAVMRHALELRPSAFSLIFDYAWDAYGGDVLAVSRALAPRPELLADMATLLVRRNRFEAGMSVWQQIQSPLPDDVREFVTALVQNARYGTAYRIWSAATLPEKVLPADDSLLANPGFEGRIQLNRQTPFHSWRIAPGGGVRVTVDRKEPQAGSQSLRVSFDLENNQPVTVAAQTIPADPKASYCLSFFVRTEELKSLSLPRVELFDPASPERAYAATPPFSAEYPNWTEQTLRLRTAAETEALTIRLQRPPCADPFCSIEGRLWLDSFTLKPCPGSER